MNKIEYVKVKQARDLLDKLLKNTIFKSSKIYFAVRDAKKLLDEVLKD